MKTHDTENDMSIPNHTKETNIKTHPTRMVIWSEKSSCRRSQMKLVVLYELNVESEKYSLAICDQIASGLTHSRMYLNVLGCT